MSLIHEIHSQRPAVRHAMFVLSAAIVLSVLGFFTYSSLQQDIFVAMNPDPADQAAFFASRDAGRPKPLAALAHAADSMLASIGSVIGWDRSAGFDRGGQQENTSSGVHLLPLSK